MQDSALSLGEKIKNLRKRAGMSQMELENAIGAANGSVSRMESNQVDPSKDTLLKISKALNLLTVERLYLLDQSYEQITQNDVQEAISTLSDVLNGDVMFGYLLDDKYNIIKISTKFSQFLVSLGVDPTVLEGKNMIEIAFNPELQVRNILDQDAFDSMAINLLSFFNQELKYRLHEAWWDHLYQKAIGYPDFCRLWKETQHQNVDVYNPVSRSVKFKLGDKIIETLYSLTALHSDPRFTIAEYKF